MQAYAETQVHKFLGTDESQSQHQPHRPCEELQLSEGQNFSERVKTLRYAFHDVEP